jgi:hypothetical protein
LRENALRKIKDREIKGTGSAVRYRERSETRRGRGTNKNIRVTSLETDFKLASPSLRR